MEKLAAAGDYTPDGLCLTAQPLFLTIREWR